MAITAEARTDIIALVVGMFDAAPGATFLSQFVNAVDAGSTIDTLAADLAGTAAFKGTYPDLQTNNEFATKFVDNLVGTEASDASKAWAVTWIEAQLNGGATKAEVIVSSINALRAIDETDANWGNAAGALNNKVTVAEWYSVDQLGNATDLATLQSQVATVTSDDTTVTDITSGSAQSGDTFTLTTGIDSVTGTAANDTITALIDQNNTDNTTLSALDSVDAAGGTDTMDLLFVGNGTDLADGNELQALPAGTVISGVETWNIRAAGDLGEKGVASLDLTGQSISTLNVTAGDDVDVDAAATTDANFSGLTGAIDVDGGKSVTITDATANQAITVGANTITTGAISVTDTAQGTGDIAVDGGSDVTVTSTVAVTTAAVAGGDITVGANDEATGTSTVVQNLTSNGSTDETHDLTAANIAVTGGTGIDITVNATSTAQNDDADGDITIGTVDATADTNTTSITVTQNATATTVETAEVAAVAETDVVTFEAMEATETLIVNGLTFTAAKDLTAAEVAVAFSNIAEGGTIGGAPSSDGLYTGTFNTAVWSSGAANGAVVTFTAQDDDETNLTFTGTATTNDAGARAPSQDQTAGTALVAADESANVVTAGAVTIEDNATAASVTTVTVDGYGAGSTIGGVNATTALTTLNLSNAAAAVDMVVADTAETLALNLEGLGTSAGDAVVTLTAAPTNLNVTSTGNNYVNLTAAATTALTVAGTGVLDADATDLTNLETVTVTGSAGVALNAGVASSLTAVDASATSGAVTVSIDGTQATYAGSTGVDTLTLSTGTALDKAIDLAAGDDTVVFDAAVTGSTAALSGGEGTDTVSMTVANAAALDATVQTFYTNFERLTLNDTFGTNDAIVDAATIDLANLGFTNYVTTTGTNQLGGAIDTLTLDNLASNGTVVLTAEGAVTVNVTDADTGSADVLNLVSNVAATDVDFGTLTAADVETVNLSANDTLEDDNSDGEVTTAEAPVEEATLVLTADEATTVNVTGSADVDLTLTGSTKVTTIDGSALTGALTVTSVNTTSATTITGGAGNDSLTGAADSDVLVGGAGNDTLTAVGELTTLTGGEGNDTFVLNTPDTVNGYATITDLSAGDVIDTVATDFSSDMVVLGDTAVFQDYANAAVNAVADGEATWFQFGGATYLVVDGGADSTSYVNGAGNDQIIKITGEVDLSTATFSTTTGDLTIA